MFNKHFRHISNATVVDLELLLSREIEGEFKESQSFKCVAIRELNKDLIPAEIMMMYVYMYHKYVSSFFIIKANCSIPVHRHIEESEMYLGGSRGIVVLNNPSQGSMCHVMQPNLFTVVDIGGSHGVTLNSMMGLTFFGIKFKR